MLTRSCEEFGLAAQPVDITDTAQQADSIEVFEHLDRAFAAECSRVAEARGQHFAFRVVPRELAHDSGHLGNLGDAVVEVFHDLMHVALLRWFVHAFAVRWVSLLEINVAQEHGTEAIEVLEADGPLLFFSRHAGPGDTILLIDRLLTRFDRAPSVVLKESVAIDPSVDLIAHRLPHAVLDTSDKDTSIYPSYTPDLKTTWREDEHMDYGSPSVLVIPARVVHTSQDVGEGAARLIDVFGPPRLDFSSKPGFVLNEADYPTPVGK